MNLTPRLYAAITDPEPMRVPGRFRSTSIVNAAMGGFLSWAARYDADPAALLQMVANLSKRVDVKDRAGRLAWQGMVTEVEVHEPGDANREGHTYTYSLEEMANAVAVIFNASGDHEWDLGLDDRTDWGTVAASVTKYGTKEKILTFHGVSEAEAESRRDTYLGLHGWPLMSQKMTEERTGYPYAWVRGRGYYWTGEWQIYTQAAWGARDTDDQMADIVTADCPFIASTDIVATGVSIQRFRNANQTAWREILRLAAMGDSSNNPLMAGVWDDRELAVDTLPTTPDYLKRRGGYVTVDGAPVEPWLLRAGKMLRQPVVPGAATLATALQDPRNSIIWQVGYNDDTGKATVTPLEARDLAGLIIGAFDAFEV